MAIPLSLVRAKLLLFGDFVCIAVSCPAVIVHRRLEAAEKLNRSYLSGRNLKDDYEETHDSTELRELADLLLCPKHEELCEETARVWEEWRPENDLFQLLELSRNPHDWRCLAEGCGKIYIISRRRALNIMETLTFNEGAERHLSNKGRKKLVKELVGLLHCDDHENSKNPRQLSERWNIILTDAELRRKSEESSPKETTLGKGKSKDALNEDTTPPQHESEAEPVRRTSGKDLFDAQSGPDDAGQFTEGLSGRPSGSGDTGQSSGGLFGKQSGSDGSGQSCGGLFGCQSSSSSSRHPRGGFSEAQFGSPEVGSSNTGFTAPQSKFTGFGSSSTGVTAPQMRFGGYGSPSSSLTSKTSKLVTDGSPAPPPVSAAEQTGTSSAELDGPGLSAADDQARHSFSSGRAASPLPNLSAVNGARSGGIPVIEGLSPSSSAAREMDSPRSRSSPSIRVFSEQSHHNRPSQPRNTSNPNLASESQNRGSDTKEAEPMGISPISSSVEALENVLFTAIHKKKFKHNEIDIKLLRYIRSTTADNGKRVNASSGDVYVLQNPAWPNHVKIGESARDTDKRIKELKDNCKIESLEQVVDTEQKFFLNYKIVEKLCHEELKNFRKILLCQSCKASKGKQKRHQEWFEVKPEIAVRTVQKWRRWMSLSPYDGDGDLVPWWREKANDELFSKDEPFDLKEEAIDDHDSRHQRWSRWLKKPTVKERADFEFWKFFLFTRPRKKSVWNSAEENIGPLLIYFIITLLVCGPTKWIVLVLLHLFLL